jgi:hypothetical protein
VEGGEQSVGEGNAAVLEYLIFLGVGSTANNLLVELLDGALLKTFQNVDSPLGVGQLETGDKVQRLTPLLLCVKQMSGDLSPALEAECLLVGVIKHLFYLLHSGCVLVGNDVNQSFEEVL